MIRSVRAIYEKGVFRPLDAVEGLAENAPVRLSVEPVFVANGTLGEFAGRWPADEADEIQAVIDAEFGRVDPREW